MTATTTNTEPTAEFGLFPQEAIDEYFAEVEAGEAADRDADAVAAKYGWTR